jgi:hypothetical protein
MHVKVQGNFCRPFANPAKHFPAPLTTITLVRAKAGLVLPYLSARTQLLPTRFQLLPPSSSSLLKRVRSRCCLQHVLLVCLAAISVPVSSGDGR